MTFKSLRASTFLAGMIGMAATAGPAAAQVDNTNPILVPVVPGDKFVNPSGTFTAFDISFADPVTGDIFIADRSNAGVDIFSGSGLTQIGRAAGFVGADPRGNNFSGPDGVLTVTSPVNGVMTTTLYAGDGNSTLKVFQFTNPASPGSALQSITTGGATRVDEMAFSPANGGRILAANNAETPAYANLFQTTGGHIGANPPGVTLLTTPGIPGANPQAPNVGIQVPGIQGGIPAGGMEQPAWNPFTTVNGPSFWVSIPTLSTGGAKDPGGISQISASGTVLQTISFNPQLLNGSISSSAPCGPSGLAVAANGNMLVGCNTTGPSQAILVDANGKFLAAVGKTPSSTAPIALGGTDEVWYDPFTNKFYAVGGPGGANIGTRFFDVIDPDTGMVLQQVNVPTTTSAHSITVNPFNGDVWVPIAAGAGCPNGCIAVYHPVPGPIAGAGLPGLILAGGGLLALARRRRRRTA
jgi:hypothetical protein